MNRGEVSIYLPNPFGVFVGYYMASVEQFTRSYWDESLNLKINSLSVLQAMSANAIDFSSTIYSLRKFYHETDLKRFSCETECGKISFIVSPKLGMMHTFDPDEIEVLYVWDLYSNFFERKGGHFIECSILHNILCQTVL